MAERKMKLSDSELQVLMDEAQEKQQGPHLTVSEEKSLQGWSFSLREWCRSWTQPSGLWGMGVWFERKEGRSYNNPSIRPPVFERGAPGPGGRGIVMGWSPQLALRGGVEQWLLVLLLVIAIEETHFDHLFPPCSFGRHQTPLLARPKLLLHLLLHLSSVPLFTRALPSGTLADLWLFSCFFLFFLKKKPNNWIAELCEQMFYVLNAALSKMN